MRSKLLAVVDGCVALIVFLLALALQLIPIDPTYVYPGALSYDFPKRTEPLAPWVLLLVVTIVPAAFLILLYDTSLRTTLPLASFLPLVLHFVFSVALGSLLCSAFHLVIGTPRPDSAAMCNNVNVTFAQCESALTHSQLVKQYRSFPAVETAVVVAAAMSFARLAELFITGSVIATIFRCLPALASVWLSAVLVATGCYRLVDVTAGALVGAFAAFVAGGATPRREQKAEELSDTTDGTSFRVRY